MSAATSAAAVAAAVAQATKASGAIVNVDPDGFLNILRRQERPLVVFARGGFLGPRYKYLSSYKGLAFYTHSPLPLDLPFDSEIVQARRIWIPG